MDYHCMLEHLLVKRVDLEPAPCWSIPLQRNTELPRTVLFQWSKPWVRWECALLRRLQTEMADENHLGPDLKCTKLLTKQDVEVSDGPNDAIAGPAGSHAKCTQKLSAACRSFVEKPAAFLSLVPDFCQTPWAALGIRLVSMRMDLP